MVEETKTRKCKTLKGLWGIYVTLSGFSTPCTSLPRSQDQRPYARWPPRVLVHTVGGPSESRVGPLRDHLFLVPVGRWSCAPEKMLPTTLWTSLTTSVVISRDHPRRTQFSILVTGWVIWSFLSLLHSPEVKDTYKYGYTRVGQSRYNFNDNPWRGMSWVFFSFLHPHYKCLRKIKTLWLR